MTPSVGPRRDALLSGTAGVLRQDARDEEDLVLPPLRVGERPSTAVDGGTDRPVRR